MRGSIPRGGAECIIFMHREAASVATSPSNWREGSETPTVYQSCEYGRVARLQAATLSTAVRVRLLTPDKYPYACFAIFFFNINRFTRDCCGVERPCYWRLGGQHLPDRPGVGDHTTTARGHHVLEPGMAQLWIHSQLLIMPIDITRTKTIIDVLRSFNSSQWAVIIFLVLGGIWAVWKVETRYAKIIEIEQRFQQSQQQLDSAHFLSLEIFGLLPESQRRQIMEKLELARQNKNKSLAQ